MVLSNTLHVIHKIECMNMFLIRVFQEVYQIFTKLPDRDHHAKGFTETIDS